MSLLKDYLQKTAPVEIPGKDIQIPPMLRKDNKKDPARFRRLTILLVIFVIVLCFTGYMFKASIQDLMNQKNTPQTNTAQTKSPPIKTVQAKTIKPNPEPVSASAPAVNSPLEQPPAKVMEQAVLPPQPQAPLIKEPDPTPNPEQKPVESPVQVQDQVEQIYPVDIEQKIQAAMEEKKTEQLPPSPEQTNTDKPTQLGPMASSPSEAGPGDYFNLGIAAQKMGDIHRAVSFYRKALILEPNHSKTLLNLSAIHMKTGNNDRAMAILKKLHDREPENVDAMVNLSILFTGEKKYDKAEALLKKAMMLQGHNTAVIFNLAYVNQLQNRLDLARELYARVSSIDRNNTKAFLAAASILEKQKKISPALGCYVQALNTKDVNASAPLRLKIENRIRLLRQIQTDAGSQIFNSEESHD